MKKRDLSEYLSALQHSKEYGPQVVWREEIAAAAAQYGAVERVWSPSVREVLETLLPEAGLYRHQVQAIDAIRAGRHVIVATPTASGKSLIYNLPVFEDSLAHEGRHALYLFPLKALAQDQLRSFEAMNRSLPDACRLTAAIYDGDTTAHFRKKMRELPPHVLMSNPDMLHLSMLGYHGQWGSFWQGLRYVVLDEVHTYRGVFGSHMAWVLRRLKRICALYGSSPQFILSSATVGNPGQLAEQLVGEPVDAVVESGAPSGKRSFLFFDPWNGAAHAASKLLEAALKRGIRTIVYTQSRKLTELISLWTSERLGPLRDNLSSYRAGFLPEERRTIEHKLASGELLGVVSTSALELGIDIGELELCILVGYPGSIMATWQRGGRVGRRQVPSAIILVAQEDALDAHFMRHPEDFFRRAPEAAVLNPANLSIIKKHLLCAAAEGPIEINNPLLSGHSVDQALEDLRQEGRLLLSADGAYWCTIRKYPHRQVDLRGAGHSFILRHTYTKEVLGEIDGLRSLKECHPGAVYLQQGETFVVDHLDLEGHQVQMHNQAVHYYTRAVSAKETEIIEVLETRDVGFQVSFGRLRVTDQVNGFQKRSVRGNKLLTTEPLDLPPNVFETEGVWVHLPIALEKKAIAKRLHFMGGIHALEHAMIGVLPLLVLCDRNDVGGISIPFHNQIEGPGVFLYDGHSGGVGLSHEAFEKIGSLLEDTLTAIQSCSCETGCPSCVHSPKCGSGNRPIDKNAALFLAKELHRCTKKNTKGRRRIEPIQQPTLVSKTPKLPKHFAVFDVETKYSAAEVGGWHRADRMGVSVAVLYDSLEDRCIMYREEAVPQMVAHLQRVDLVVGFNNKRFDNRVLSAYTAANLNALPSCDILEEVNKKLGYRLSLDALAGETLGTRKTADGLQALQWYKEGRIEKIAQYCEQDVVITRDLFLFGLREGYLLFQNKAGNVVRCPFRPEW